ncbi:MAG: cadmium-translocating P-type ATPase [Verrucomicrobia bacterium]|nr:cadmium-translocating P-type ATPase [Verrucomicrobiota bacterium]MCH8513588.1 cadmium-translocating P-type ATPase [Kiritimatiellia bacterium]
MESKHVQYNSLAQRMEMLLMIVCGIALVVGFSLERMGMESRNVLLGVWGLVYVTGGYFGVLSGTKSLRAGVVDVDLLMVLAALGAAYVGAPFEGGMLLFLFALSNVLQSHAMDRSRKAIGALMRLRPDKVLVREGDHWVERKVDDVNAGAVIRVKPGEGIALDGHVLSGESAVDESTLTGESIPAAKRQGDAVFSGTMNQSGSLEIEVTKPASESTLARIVKMVEEAQSQKADTQRFLEKAEQHYALGVILFTLGLIFLPWRVFGHPFDETFYRAMTVMVVASPCALIISTPAAFLSAIGGAARQGVLFKGGVHLERLASVRIVAFDKTGTLTEGRPVVTDVVPLNGMDSDTLLQWTAALEAHSEHPLGEAVVRASKKRGLAPWDAENFQALSGKGATAMVAGRHLVAGSYALFQEWNAPLEGEGDREAQRLQEAGRSLVLLGICAGEGQIAETLGILGVADTVRPGAKEMVRALKKLGIERVAMLTGDHPVVARQIAKEAGIDEVYAGLLPEDKLSKVKELAGEGNVAMVGDGVNDAPALAAAHVGIAMGAVGTDVAMETADVVLMSENLHHLAFAFALGRRTRRIVTQNLVFAMGVILVLVSLSLTIGIPLPLGVVGHEGSTVLVCLNGLRLLRFRGDA